MLLYDRGYPSYDFIYEHTKKGLDYLMRVKVSFSKTIIAFEQSKKKSCVVELYPGKNSKLSEKEYSKKLRY